MITYLALIILTSIAFAVGWIMKSIVVADLVKKAKHDIRYVDVLKSKSYSKGWNTGFEYGNRSKEVE